MKGAKSSRKQAPDVPDEPSPADVELCWLCHRELGSVVEWHHPIPKSRGGRQKQPVHPICHNTLHASFTNSVLARHGADRDWLLSDDALARFVEWVSVKPADFYAPTRKG